MVMKGSTTNQMLVLNVVLLDRESIMYIEPQWPCHVLARLEVLLHSVPEFLSCFFLAACADYTVSGDDDVDGSSLGETVILHGGDHGGGHLFVHSGGRGFMVCGGGGSGIRCGE